MNPQFARSNPLEADLLAREGGVALRLATRSPKRGARALGVGERVMRYWYSAEKQSAVSQSLLITASVENPYPIIAAHRIAAEQALLCMTDEQLAQAFRDAMVEETKLQGEMDILQIMRGGMPEIRTHAFAHAAILERIAGLASELEKRGLDPWRTL